MKYLPEKYHTQATEFILAHKRCGLLMEMGLGKTGSTLTAINALLWNWLEVTRVLVVAPLRPALITWPDEIEKWDHTKNLRYVVCYGGDKLAKLKADVEIVIMSYSTLPWLHTQVENKEPSLPKFDMVVLDESTRVKNSSSDTWKYCKFLFTRVPRIVELTGTPSPNSIGDLWAQAYLLDKGASLFRNKSDFLSHYFKRVGEVEFQKWEVLPGSDVKILSRCAHMYLAMKSDDYINLPPFVLAEVKVKLPKNILKMYKDLAKNLLLEFDFYTLEVASSSGRDMKLRQLTQGFVYDDNGAAIDIHTEKIKALKELRESIGNENMLTAFQFKHEANILKKHIGDVPVINSNTSALDSVKYLNHWNSGTLQDLLIQPTSVSHGLNLQSGGNIIVHYSIDYNFETHAQLNTRLRRRGQTKPVFLYYIVAEDTLDEVMFKALKRKETNQNMVFDLFKEYLELIN